MEANSFAGEEKKTMSVFEQELQRMRMPPQLVKLLQEKASQFKPLVDIMNEKAGWKSIGFYVTPEIKFSKEGKPDINFEKLTLRFMFDDNEHPIADFRPEVLLGKDLFEEYLEVVEEKESITYYVKGTQRKIVFSGSTIFRFREQCLVGEYAELKALNLSLVYQDERGFLMAMKTIEMHKDRVLEQLRKHVVVYAGAGSWVRGEKSNDFDVYVVIDDTDVREAPRYVIKEQITRLLYQFEAEIAQITGVRIHIQTYLLTEFWESIKDAHPVIFTFLRDGLAIYDRGMFTIWKELLKMGKIKPSPEAIEMHMSAGNVLVEKLKGSAREVAENLYYAVLNPSQALIMLKGYEPSTPKETVNILREIFVKKEGMLAEEDVELVEKLRAAYKGFEHDPNFSLKFSDIDAYVTGVEEYLKKIRELFENISTGNIKDVIDKTDEEINSLLKSLEVTSNNPAEELREKYVNIGDLAGFIVEYLKDFKTIKEKHSSEDKLTQSEVSKAVKEGRILINELKSYLSRKEVDKQNAKKMLVRAGEDTYAELFATKEGSYLGFQGKLHALKGNVFEEIKPEDFKGEGLENLEFTNELYAAVADKLGSEKFTIIRR